MIASVLINVPVVIMHSLVPFAQMCSSRDGSLELKIDCARHLHSLGFRNVREAKKVLQGECWYSFVLAGPMTDKPRNDGCGVFLVLDIGLNEI